MSRGQEQVSQGSALVADLPEVTIHVVTPKQVAPALLVLPQWLIPKSESVRAAMGKSLLAESSEVCAVQC